jgi:transposase, IS30 family
MRYKHLNAGERDEIAVQRSQGKTWRVIAQGLGRSHATLVREWHRNRHKPPWGARVYYPHTANKKAQERLRESHRRIRLKSMDLRLEVLKRLETYWSPELIAGRLKRVRPDLPTISPEAIYQWIYSQRKDLIMYLARSHRKRFPRRHRLKRRLRIPGRVPLRERPETIQTRQEPGHWETDLMIGSGEHALQVLVERQTRYSRLRRVTHKTASVCRAALTQTLQDLPESLRKSITYDNGPENFEHQILNEDFQMRSFFCEPYHSWEKGTVENTNGLIRRFFTRQHCLAQWSDQDIAAIEIWLNNRPRTILNFQTPQEAFRELGALKG